MSVDPRQREQYWQEQIGLWKDSGLSKARFCQDKEYPAHKLTYWDQRFRKINQPPKSPSGFVAVRSVLPPAIKITLGNGVTIEGLCALSIKELGELARTLVTNR